MNELLAQSATDMAKAVRSGEVSSRELVQAHLDHMDRVNPLLNAVVTRCDDAALEAADAADQLVADRARLGLFHGVPITIKDALDTAGVVTTGGTKGREHSVPETTASAVQRLLDAGAILTGKTNTPDLTLSYETTNLIFGQTFNPYDPALSPGGSSGGAAAIIAACGSPLDLGSDTGGSIRLPAHFCGIAGIRPTSGRVPRTGLIVPVGSPIDSVTVVGPMARTVEDLIVALGVVGGPDAIDASIVPMPLGDAFNNPLRRLRVAMYVDDGSCPAEPDVVAAVRAAAGVLRDAGAVVVESTPPGVDQSVAVLGRVFRGDRRGWLVRLLDSWGTTEHEFQGVDVSGPPASDYFDGLIAFEAFRAAMLGWMRDFDLVVCPPHANTALPPGVVSGDNYNGAGYLQTYNITGWPGVVVRAGTTDAGLPVGVQLVAPAWQDHVALAGALEVERALGGWQPPPMLAA